ncbi:MAG: GH116 family glycosyl-hydrolase, partial [Verrucomicrobia bacterium]|nr:GH116 family glycosyl-hydrolase [Verrucomicrobiota bacterium]
RDWNIFNNSPGGGGGKVQLEDALFGIWVKPADAPSRAWALRTQPPAALPPIAQVQYSGAYPVSRLRFSDPHLPLEVQLYAYSEWALNDAARSATPAIVFTFTLSNPSRQAVETAVMFNLPDHQGGVISGTSHGLRWDRAGTAPMSGSMCLRFDDQQAVTKAVHDNLKQLWSTFAQEGQFAGELPEGAPRNGAVAARIKLPPRSTRTLSLVLSWYFPNRTHANSQQRIGNYYTTLFPSAEAVAGTVLARLPQTWKALEAWQRLCFDNDLPDWLKDSLLNSIGNMAKTGFWTEDGRWRQWESFSCANLEPVHIHFYRALPYGFFFPELQKSQFRGFASRQRADGFIYEDLGNSSNKLDEPGGRDMGDCTTGFILGVYELYLWTGDRAFLNELWPNVRKAANWQIQRSAHFGLPEHLNNTYDWWGFEGKDVVAYNAMMHLAALRATGKLAESQGDPGFVQLCRAGYESGARRADELLWNGHYYRAWWMEKGGYPEALHADTLYGQVWASVLGLGWLTDPARAQAHLAAEREHCASPYGLKVMYGRGKDSIDDLVWQAGSLDWTISNLYLGAPVGQSLVEAEKVVDVWRKHLNDSLDWRDLTRSDNGQPWCNSHYGRQVIFWAIPLALSGQQYSAVERRLSFAPRPDAPARLPWFVPGAGG